MVFDAETSLYNVKQFSSSSLAGNIRTDWNRILVEYFRMILNLLKKCGRMGSSTLRPWFEEEEGMVLVIVILCAFA